MKVDEYFRDLYLQDLGKIVTYKNRNPRPRVRHIKMWEQVESKIPEGAVVPLQLPPRVSGRQVWLWSDLHLNHKNIIEFSNRPFPDIETMNDALIQNFRDYVGPSDISIWVGDITFMGNTRTNELLDKCPGYKILIVGNHDFNKKKIRALNFDEIHMVRYIPMGDVEFVLSHYPMENLPERYFNIHGHTHDYLLDSMQHINVSVESPYVHYRPVNLNVLYQMAKLRVQNKPEPLL